MKILITRSPSQNNSKKTREVESQKYNKWSIDLPSDNNNAFYVLIE